MTLRIVGNEVRGISLEKLRPFARENPEFYDVAGREHYRLLAYLSTKVDGTIVDIGTHRGASALALSYDEGNTVLTFDVVDKAPPIIDGRRNVHRFIRDLTVSSVREAYKTALLESPLILLDIDPHEGDREWELLEWLRENRYRGTILLDDVWHFKELREKVWYRLGRAGKVDLSAIGHWSGTGAVRFDGRVTFDEEPTQEELDGWTLVTGYFDLTNEPDANPEIKARPPELYLEEHSTSTLSLEHDLIVYTEPRFEETIWRKRPVHLHPRTRVRLQDFSDFPLFKHRETIWLNRKGHHCARDPRNTASYYLFCMARSAMLKEAIVLTEAPFFAWINVCIERYGVRNLMHLDEALSARRQGFSTCRIAYAKPSPDDLGTFFGPNGCADPSSSCGGSTFCSGFYTGDRVSMAAACSLMEDEFSRCLSLGFGHADEQIMALVHAKRPDLFNWYAGDYAEMITNYVYVRENAGAPIRNLLLPAIAARDWDVATGVAAKLWYSYLNGKCTLMNEELDQLLWAMREVRKHS